MLDIRTHDGSDVHQHENEDMKMPYYCVSKQTKWNHIVANSTKLAFCYGLNSTKLSKTSEYIIVWNE